MENTSMQMTGRLMYYQHWYTWHERRGLNTTTTSKLGQWTLWCATCLHNS